MPARTGREGAWPGPTSPERGRGVLARPRAGDGPTAAPAGLRPEASAPGSRGPAAGGPPTAGAWTEPTNHREARRGGSRSDARTRDQGTRVAPTTGAERAGHPGPGGARRQSEASPATGRRVPTARGEARRPGSGPAESRAGGKGAQARRERARQREQRDKVARADQTRQRRPGAADARSVEQQKRAAEAQRAGTPPGRGSGAQHAAGERVPGAARKRESVRARGDKNEERAAAEARARESAGARAPPPRRNAHRRPGRAAGGIPRAGGARYGGPGSAPGAGAARGRARGPRTVSLGDSSTSAGSRPPRTAKARGRLNIPAGTGPRALAKSSWPTRTVVSDANRFFTHLHWFRATRIPKRASTSRWGPGFRTTCWGKRVRGDIKLYRFTVAEGSVPTRWRRSSPPPGCARSRVLKIARDPSPEEVRRSRAPRWRATSSPIPTPSRAAPAAAGRARAGVPLPESRQQADAQRLPR